MPVIKDPDTGLEFYELSHPWGMYTPIFPGYEEIKLERLTYHAKHGVMTHKITTIFHTSTHVNAPIHLIPEAPAIGDLPLERFFGSGVVLSIPKGKWELVEPADLNRVKPEILEDDIVIINTGWHRRYSDSQDYFGHAPGLSKQAAEWLRAQSQARRRRHWHRRSSARDLDRPASQRPPNQVSFAGIQKGDWARGDCRFSRLESRAPHAALRRYPNNRECRR
jgi:hypothetical protein